MADRLDDDVERVAEPRAHAAASSQSASSTPERRPRRRSGPRGRSRSPSRAARRAARARTAARSSPSPITAARLPRDVRRAGRAGAAPCTAAGSTVASTSLSSSSSASDRVDARDVVLGQPVVALGPADDPRARRQVARRRPRRRPRAAGSPARRSRPRTRCGAPWNDGRSEPQIPPARSRAEHAPRRAAPARGASTRSKRPGAVIAYAHIAPQYRAASMRRASSGGSRPPRRALSRVASLALPWPFHWPRRQPVAAFHVTSPGRSPPRAPAASVWRARPAACPWRPSS